MDLYPPIEPHDAGLLEVGEGNAIYWEVCGNPRGKPAVTLHGGPGAGSNPEWRRWFDPEAYRVVSFDQRGAGRSTPHASGPSVDLSSNTTHHLVRDIERLREHLGIERWLVCGGSWGSTLGLAYAEHHTERVSELVLFSVALTRRSDVDWLTRAVGRLFPEAWRRFRDGVPAPDRDGNLADAYARLLASSDECVRDAAARDWCDWESAHVAVRAGDSRDPRYEDPLFRMAFDALRDPRRGTRLVTHYFRHAAWLEEDELLEGASRLAGTPGSSSTAVST